MPKPRRPFSRQFAVAQAIELLGIEVAAEITGLSGSHLRATSDADRAKDISLRAAEALDRALIEHGEEPINYLAYGRRLRVGDAADSPSLCLKRVLAEIDHAAHVIERSPDHRLAFQEIAWLLIEVSRRAAELAAVNCQRQGSAAADGTTKLRAVE